MEGFLKIRVTPKTYLDGFSWIFHDVSSHWGTPMAVQVPGSPSFSKEHEDFDLAGSKESMKISQVPTVPTRSQRSRGRWSLLSGATNGGVPNPKIKVNNG